MYYLAAIQRATNGIGGDEVPDPVISEIHGATPETADHVRRFGPAERPVLARGNGLGFRTLRSWHGQQARHARNSLERRNPFTPGRFEDVPAQCDQPDHMATNRGRVGMYFRWAAQ